MIAEMDKAKGARGSGSNQHQVRSHGTTAPSKTLSDLNISKDQSSRWQKLAVLAISASLPFSPNLPISADLPISVNPYLRLAVIKTVAQTRFAVQLPAALTVGFVALPIPSLPRTL